MYLDGVLNLAHLYAIPPFGGLMAAVPFWGGLHGAYAEKKK
jgi:hypothetical protein